MDQNSQNIVLNRKLKNCLAYLNFNAIWVPGTIVMRYSKGYLRALATSYWLGINTIQS